LSVTGSVREEGTGVSFPESSISGGRGVGGRGTWLASGVAVAVNVRGGDMIEEIIGDGEAATSVKGSEAK
jgi:hypothetical protein